jgi:hypothetical protein
MTEIPAAGYPLEVFIMAMNLVFLGPGKMTLNGCPYVISLSPDFSKTLLGPTGIS